VLSGASVKQKDIIMNNEIMWQFFLGIALGISTNLISWWILFHVLKPNVCIAEEISKTEIDNEPFNKSGVRYRVKFLNTGARAIIDVQVTAKLRVKGLQPLPKNVQIFNIPLNADGSLVYTKEIVGKSKGFIVRFYISSGLVAEYPTFLPKEILSKSKQNALCLEDLLTFGTDPYIEIYVFGYDKFSGTRKLFISTPLTLDTIKDGNFEIGRLSVREKTDSTPINN
jgi:hypothetical protein